MDEKLDLILDGQKASQEELRELRKEVSGQAQRLVVVEKDVSSLKKVAAGAGGALGTAAALITEWIFNR